MKTKLTIIFILFQVLCYPIFIEAKLLQILHTNDLHSHFENATNQSNKIGGHARLKYLIDKYRQWGKDNDAITILVDAGDFLEGTFFYKAGDGFYSLKIMEKMGYDAMTLGNHDYNMGETGLAELIQRTSIQVPILSANIEWAKDKKNMLQSKIKPYTIINKQGFKIGIVGATSNDTMYRWLFQNSKIISPYRPIKKYAQEMSKLKTDFNMALTHLGLFKDKKLALHKPDIDLIVGGHSHTKLEQIKKLRGIYITQTEGHGKRLGRILFELDKRTDKRQVQLISSQFISVTGPRDKTITDFIQQAKNSLNAAYGKEYLNGPIAYSPLRAGHEKSKRCWDKFISMTFAQTANTDYGLHSWNFSGHEYPVGQINRIELFNSYPRIIDINNNLGNTIYTATLKGKFLIKLIKFINRLGIPIYIAANSNARPIKHNLEYSIALDQGVALGLQAYDKYAKHFFENFSNTHISIWEALESRINQLECTY